MNTNVEILKQLGILGDVRKRLDAEDENDTSKDEQINKLTSEECVAKWSGWNLGDEAWATYIIHYFKELEFAKKS